MAVLGSLGVVFGDIGTSPLYALTTVFADTGDAHRAVVFGTTSMVIWSAMLIVTVLYVRILMRFDNDGEGGLLALLGLIRRAGPTPRIAAAATALAILGAAMFFGDSLITPAVSVLSAVEGLTVAHPGLDFLVIPIVLTVLVVLFAVQKYGTARIGILFGPIMLVWFLALGAMGLGSTVQTPEIFGALSPHWIVLLVAEHPWTALVALGGVVLAITGAEALFADMGHFGRGPITVAWLVVVFPALILNYLGQGAAVLRRPADDTAPFFALVPTWATLPTTILATAATVIASQAVISGMFSAVQQAARLGLLPRIRVVHTSATSSGQIYVPAVNLVIAVAVVVLVLTFRSADALTSAYGIAVTVTVSVTTILLLLLLATRGLLRRPRTVGLILLLLVVFAFFAANLPKIATGGWVPLLVAAVAATLMWTWSRGRRRVLLAKTAELLPVSGLPELLDGPPQIVRTPGTAVYLAVDVDVTPVAMLTSIEQSQSLQRRAVIISVDTSDSPHEHRTEVHRIGHGITAVRIVLGYRHALHLQELLAQTVAEHPAEFSRLDPERVIYVLSSSTPRASPHSPMPSWQQRLYLLLDRISPDLLDGFDLPRDRTVVIGRAFTL